ncbi:MAG: hypothetical protein ACPGXY_05495 [Alphaproteobacteria bacterium]
MKYLFILLSLFAFDLKASEAPYPKDNKAMTNYLVAADTEQLFKDLCHLPRALENLETFVETSLGNLSKPNGILRVINGQVMWNKQYGVHKAVLGSYYSMIIAMGIQEVLGFRANISLELLEKLGRRISVQTGKNYNWIGDRDNLDREIQIGCAARLLDMHFESITLRTQIGKMTAEYAAIFHQSAVKYWRYYVNPDEVNKGIMLNKAWDCLNKVHQCYSFHGQSAPCSVYIDLGRIGFKAQKILTEMPISPKSLFCTATYHSFKALTSYAGEKDSVLFCRLMLIYAQNAYNAAEYHPELEYKKLYYQTSIKSMEIVQIWLQQRIPFSPRILDLYQKIQIVKKKHLDYSINSIMQNMEIIPDMCTLMFEEPPIKKRKKDLPPE